MKRSFSLIEVLFAIAFLIMVGVAMISLNTAAARLTAASEVKQVALGLNEQAISFIALEKRTKSDFGTTYAECITIPSGDEGEGSSDKTCYVSCPTDVKTACSLATDRSSVQLGANKLQFTQAVIIRETGSGGQLLINSTSSWGSGPRSRLSTARVIE